MYPYKISSQLPLKKKYGYSELKNINNGHKCSVPTKVQIQNALKGQCSLSQESEGGNTLKGNK